MTNDPILIRELSQDLGEVAALSEDTLNNQGILYASAVSAENPVEASESFKEDPASARREVNAFRADREMRLILDEVNSKMQTELTEQGFKDVENMVNFSLIRSQQEDPYSVEKEGVEKLKDLSYKMPEYAELVSNLENVSMNGIEAIEDYTKKTHIFQRRLEELVTEEEERNLFTRGIDFLGGLLPFNMAKTLAASYEKDPAILKVLSSGYVALDARTKLFNLPLKDFEEALDDTILNIRENSGWFGENLQLTAASLASLQSLSPESRGTETILNDLDVLDIPIGAAVSAIIKTVKNPLKMAKVLGNRTVAVAQASSTLKDLARGKVSSIFKTEDILSELTPSNARPFSANGIDDISLGISNSIAADGKYKEILDTFLERFNRAGGATIDMQDLADSMKKAEQVFKETAQPHTVDIISDFEALTASENPIASYIVGSGTGKSFRSHRLAKKYADSIGLPADSREFVRDANGWFLKVDKGLEANKKLITFSDDEIEVSNSFTAKLKSQRAFIPQSLQELSTRSQFLKNSLQTATQPLVKTLEQLPSSEKKSFNKVIYQGLTEKRWYSNDELDLWYNLENNVATGAPKSFKEAYTANRVSNDLDYIMANKTIYENKKAQGVKKFVIGSDKPFEVEGTLKLPTTDFRGLVVDRGLLLHSPKQDTYQELMDKGYSFIRLFEPMDFGDAGIVDSLIVKEWQDLPLNPTQLSYVAGGHRAYATNWFAKQSNIKVAKDGTQYALSPLVHATSFTKKEMEEYVQRFNNSLGAFQKLKKDLASGGLEATEEKILRDFIEDCPHPDLNSVEDFESAISKGTLTTEPLEVLYDREMPTSTAAFKNNPFDYSGNYTDGAIQYLNTKKGLVYGSKGEHLRDVYGDPATLIDPIKVNSIVLERAIDSAAYMDYRVNALNNFASIVKDNLQYLENATEINLGNPMNVLFRADFKKSGVAGADIFRAKMNALRHSIQRNLGLPTESSLRYQRFLRRSAEAVGVVSQKGEKFLFDKFSKNPINALKGFAFTLKMGFGDLSQLLIQTQTAVAATAISPVAGTKAWRALAPLRMALINGTDELTSYLGTNKAFKALHGLEKEEFKLLRDSIDKSGIMNVSGETAIIDHYGDQILPTYVGRTARALGDLGRIPFVEAERTNRLVAFATSWFEQRAKGVTPQQLAFSKTAMNKLLQRTDDLAMNMTKASKAWWQDGIISVPTQFWAYQSRMIEAMLPTKLGGSKAFTTSEKFRLTASQALLYGSAGIPLGTWAAEQIVEATGTSLSEEQSDLLTKGLIDGIIRNTTGVDTAFAERAGVGAGVDQILYDLFFDKNLVEVFSGASGSIYVKMFEDYKFLMDYMVAERVPYGRLVQEFLNTSLKQISSFSRYSRAYYVWKYGTYLHSKTGEVQLENLPPQAAIAAALGIPFDDIVDAYKLFEKGAESKELIKDLSTEVYRLRLEALNNPDRADAISAQVATLLEVYTKDNAPLRDEVLEQVNLKFSKRNGVDLISKSLSYAKKSGVSAPLEITE